METPQICLLGKASDGVTMMGIKVFQFVVSDLCLYMGADKCSEDAMLECGELAYSEAHWLSLAELKLFTVRVKTGQYTSHKNFSPAILMEFLKEFLGEMLRARGEYYGAKKQESKWVEPENPISVERMAALFEETKQNLTKELKQQEYNDAVNKDLSVEQKLERRINYLKKAGVDTEIIEEMEQLRNKNKPL